MAATVRVKLNPDALRMAKSMKRLFNIIGRRDAKVILSPRVGKVIFPLDDATLQAAITTVLNRLNAVITP